MHILHDKQRPTLGRGQLAALLIGCTLAHTLPAAQPFRWRLQPEQTYQLQITWSCQQSRPTLDLSERTLAELSWKVLSVDDQGNFDLVQTLTHVIQSVEYPSLGLVEFDSQTPTEAKGAATDMAAYWKPLLGVECPRRLTPRGKILLSAETPAPQTKETSLLRRDFGQEPWRSVLRQGYPEFPEQALEPGQHWTHQDETVLPLQAGRCVWVTRYTYEGTQSGEGHTPTERFRVGRELKVEPSTGPPSIAIQTNRSEGTFLFDLEAGHLVSSQLDQDFTLTVVQPGLKPLATHIVASVQVQFSPAVAEPPKTTALTVATP